MALGDDAKVAKDDDVEGLTISTTGLGVSLAIAGTMVSALGNHLIVKSHAKKLDPFWAQTYFLLGNCCVVVLGTTLGITALAYAPQSLISPLGGLTIVWNLGFAILPFFGGVKPRTAEIMATLLTLLGTMMIVWLGPENRGLKNTFQMFMKPPFVALATTYSAMGLWLESKARSSQSKLYRRIAAGAVGGFVGGLSNVFAKSAVDFHSGNQVLAEASDYSTFGLVVVIALALAASQLMFLNNALAAFPAVQIVPIYQTTLIVAATISGGIAFEEFDDFSFMQYLGFGCGVLLSVIGVGFLASLSSSSIADEMKD